MSLVSVILIVLLLLLVCAGLVWAAFVDRSRGEEISEDLHAIDHEHQDGGSPPRGNG